MSNLSQQESEFREVVHDLANKFLILKRVVQTFEKENQGHRLAQMGLEAASEIDELFVKARSIYTKKKAAEGDGNNKPVKLMLWVEEIKEHQNEIEKISNLSVNFDHFESFDEMINLPVPVIIDCFHLYFREIQNFGADAISLQFFCNGIDLKINLSTDTSSQTGPSPEFINNITKTLNAPQCSASTSNSENNNSKLTITVPLFR